MALILIIDDSSFTRKRIASMVEAEGHETLEASDGRQGLEMTATHSPDCIVIDLIMPEMDGLELLKLLHNQGSKVPRIVVTADIQESVRQECLESGALAVLNKPPRKDELQNALAEALGS